MVEMNGNLMDLALIAMAQYGRMVCPSVDSSSVGGPYFSGDRDCALWCNVGGNIRRNVSCLRALRRCWLPMWSLREDANGQNIRRAARAMGAHLDTSRRARPW